MPPKSRKRKVTVKSEDAGSLLTAIKKEPQGSDDEFGDIGDEEFRSLAEAVEGTASKRLKSTQDSDAFDVDSKEFLSLAEAAEGAVHGIASTAQSTDKILDGLLKDVFGIPSFRPPQKEVIRTLVDGNSALVIMPTGGGKSLCYQLTALAIEGLTIVVSPLIALMKDQTEYLKRKGVSAESIDSTKSAAEYNATMARAETKELKLLFVAPERLNNEKAFILSLLKLRDGVSLIAIDEAHCISEWGHAFRPDYLKIARFVEEMEVKRVVCLTATATPKVAADICDVFKIERRNSFRTSSFRPNLRLLIEPIEEDDKFLRLVGFLRQNTGTAIVYVTFQHKAEDIAKKLADLEINAKAYHGGMEKDKRAEAQDAFMKVKNIVIVATIAFGMGIDRADIRAVVHYDMPRSLEGYSQEIGRAGRDDEPSTCLYFLCNEDVEQREIFARGTLPSLDGVFRLLKDFFNQKSRAPIGTTLEARKNEQSNEYDIVLHVLGNIYAQLELHNGLIREIGPRYEHYSFKPLRPSAISGDPSPEARAIRQHWQVKRIWTYVDVPAAASTADVDRDRIAWKLRHWADQTLVELSAKQLVNRYRVVKQLPETEDEMHSIAYSCWIRLREREKDEITRFNQTISFATRDQCLAAQLAAYFRDSIPNGRCDNCSYCLTQRAVIFVPLQPSAVDMGLVNTLVHMYGQYRDARLIARIAFGIKSPRIRRLGLLKDPEKSNFGKVKNCDFDDFLSKTESSMQEKKLLDGKRAIRPA